MEQNQRITAEELERAMEGEESPTVVDIRDAESYGRGHVPGAINIDAFQPDFTEQARQHMPSLDAQIVVYGSSSASELSSVAARNLQQAGYASVRQLEGGLKEWVGRDSPLEGSDVAAAKEELRAAAPENARTPEEEIASQAQEEDFSEEDITEEDYP